MLKLVYELRIELRDFFTQQKTEELVKFLQDDVVSLAYLVDIFGRMNELNLSLQGKDKTIINFIDVLSAFQAKLQLWERKMAIDKIGMFPTLNELLEDTEDVWLDDNVKSQIINNLQSLRSEFAKYFPVIARHDLAFVRNPYLVADVVNMFDGDDNTQEEFIALRNDSTTEDAFKEKTLPAFWLAMASSYPKVASTAIRLLMPFPSTYLCEAVFSALLGIKTKARNKLAVEPDLRCALSTTVPRIDNRVARLGAFTPNWATFDCSRRQKFVMGGFCLVGAQLAKLIFPLGVSTVQCPPLAIRNVHVQVFPLLCYVILTIFLCLGACL